MSLILVESWDGYGQTNGAAPSASIEEKWDLDRTSADVEDGQTGKSIEPGTQLVASKVGKIGNHEYLTLGFAYKHTGLNTTSFVGGFLDGGSVNVNIIITTTGELAVRKGSDTPFATGTTQLVSGVWYWIELYARTHNTSGEYELRIDGVTEISGTGLNTRDGANNYSNRVFFSGGSLNAVIDDVYVNNDTGGNFYGPCYVEQLRPSADTAQKDWTPDTGTDNYSRVNEVGPDGDTSYVETSTVSAMDLYDFDSLVGTGDIIGVQMNAHSKNGTFNLVAKNINTQAVDPTANTGSYVCYSWVWETQPLDSGPWTKDDLNDTQFGISRTGGTPRVTRLDIDVLYLVDSGPVPIEEEVETVMSIGHTVEDDLELGTQVVSSAMTLSQTLSVIGPITVSVASVMTMSGSATRDIDAEADSEITLTDEATLETFEYSRYIPEGMYDGTLFDINNVPMFSDDLIHLIQTVVTSGTRSLSASSVISLSQSVTASQSVINKSISSIISMSQIAGREFEESASSVMTLLGEAERTYWEESELSLSSVASAFVGRNARSTLALTQTVTVNVIGDEDASNDLQINQSLLYIIEGSGQECNYSIQVGTVGSGITPPPTEQPFLGSGILTLSASGADTVVLRNPDFGNIHRLNFMRIKTESRGGTLLMYADPDWPKEQVFTFTIEGLSEDQKDALLTFVATTLGKEITLQDHEERLWLGLIITPDLDITHVGRHNYSVSFDFEGEPLEPIID